MSITAMKQAVQALIDIEIATDLKRLYRHDDEKRMAEVVEDAINALRTAIQEAEKQEPVGRIASNGYPELYKPHSLPAWTLLYLAAGAQHTPEGYQLVPLEPTDKMVQASLHLDLSYMPLQEGYDRAAVYKAMLAAAPPQAQPAKQMTDGAIEFKRYLIDCDKNAIEPDVAGAFNAGWQATHGIKEQP